MSLLVHGVVGELDLLEGDVVLHPLGAGGRRVRVDVDARRPLRFSLARTDPAGREAEARVVVQRQVHQHVVLGVGVQSAQLHLQRREHAPAQFGDDHLGAQPVEFVPQLAVLQTDVDGRIALHGRRRRHQLTLQRRSAAAAAASAASARGGQGWVHFC